MSEVLQCQLCLAKDHKRDNWSLTVRLSDSSELEYLRKASY